MRLLSDGSVIALDANNNQSWYRLTPDIHGSYVNGTWTTIASMNYSRLYFATQILQDGNLFAAGGEYGTGMATSELYNTLTNKWTRIPVPTSLLNPADAPPQINGNQAFLDSGSEILANGNVLVAPVGPKTVDGTLIFSATTSTWSAGPATLADQDECSWVKLPDNSILTVDTASTTSERYIPSLNEWIDDSTVPVQLFDVTLDEIGAAFLLPSGKAFFIGDATHTALYSPSGATTSGTWAAGANMPSGMGAADAAAAMMPNGKILCALGPIGNQNPPTTFYEYDPVANSFTGTTAPGGGSTDDVAEYTTCMLDLPDGTVLYSHFGQDLYVYTPSGSPLAAGKPAITVISQNTNGSYLLKGTLLNGISEGAAYGDDWQMNTNYPIVRLTGSSGNVYYARTYNWSSTSVMTGATPVTTQFTMPAGLPPETYSIVAVANGISSNPYQFNTCDDVNGDGHPDVVIQNSVTKQIAVVFLSGSLGTTVGASPGISPAVLSNTNAQIVGMGDFNGSGHQDLVFQDSSNGNLGVVFLTGSQGLVASGTAPIGQLTGGSRVVGVGDFNSDGHPDLVVQNPSTHQVSFIFLTGTQGTTILSTASLSPALLSDASAEVAGVADFNNDGHPDLVWQDPSTKKVGVSYLGGSQGITVSSSAFLSPALLSDTNGTVVAVADLKLNGHPDLIWQDYSNQNVGAEYLTGTGGITVSGTSVPQQAPPTGS